MPLNFQQIIQKKNIYIYKLAHKKPNLIRTLIYYYCINIIVDQIFNFTKILILQSMIRRILVKANEFHLFKTSIF